MGFFHNDRDDSLEVEVVGSLHFASHSNQNSDTGGSDWQRGGSIGLFRSHQRRADAAKEEWMLHPLVFDGIR
jgi:hypothetical protein